MRVESSGQESEGHGMVKETQEESYKEAHIDENEGEWDV